MELIEILAILILLGVLAAVALLVVLLLRKHPTADPSSAAEATARAMTDTLRKEVTEPILREERNSQSTLRTEMQTELRGSRTEMTNTVQTSVDKLGQSLRESQRETAELQAKRISDLTASEERLMNELAQAQTRRFEAQYAAFGRVTEGMNVVDKIASCKTGRYGFYSDVPRVCIMITDAAVVPGDEAR